MEQALSTFVCSSCLPTAAYLSLAKPRRATTWHVLLLLGSSSSSCSCPCSCYWAPCSFILAITLLLLHYLSNGIFIGFQRLSLSCSLSLSLSPSSEINAQQSRGWQRCGQSWGGEGELKTGA